MTKPEEPGHASGRLAPCPSSPNCVCSQADPDDRRHYIAPLSVPAGENDPVGRLATVIDGMPRTRIVTRETDYLHAEFKTRIMGFVDDLELYAPPGESVVHVRSASRLGYSDFGVNRKRAEALRDAFARG